VNKLARWLVPGDRFEVRGLLDHQGVLHIEQIRITSCVARQKQRPSCENCGQRLKSMGADQGLRCPSCRRRYEDGWVEIVPEPPFRGWVEPSIDARRHLARPLDWADEK
jgi:tRNA(Ile2)-agmatinylcytidine synthase